MLYARVPSLDSPVDTEGEKYNGDLVQGKDVTTIQEENKAFCLLIQTKPYGAKLIEAADRSFPNSSRRLKRSWSSRRPFRSSALTGGRMGQSRRGVAG